ncbi:hypothetical protein [Persephonella sp. IF05-L8]|uniref:hypothetical protein n=1 Tax=Persephonella sp. IF05-L8 TaxID=1158338 RepID=UPI0004964CCE
MSKERLDALITDLSFKIINEINNLEKKNDKKKALNLIDKALGVLSNDGVYAYYVYIISQKNGEFNKIFLDSLEEIFNIAKYKEAYNSDSRQNYFKDITNDIHKLLFLKQLLEKTLIYARYHAKALQDGE